MVPRPSFELNRMWEERDPSSPRGLDICGQATKGAWGMSWRQKAMKGVEVCEKPGGVDKQVMMPGFPTADG